MSLQLARVGHVATPAQAQAQRSIPTCLLFLIADYSTFQNVMTLRRVDRAFNQIFGFDTDTAYWSRLRSLRLSLTTGHCTNETDTTHSGAHEDPGTTLRSGEAKADEANVTENVRRLLGRLRMAEVVRIEWPNLDEECIGALCSACCGSLKELHLSRAARISVSRLTKSLSQCASLHTLGFSNIWVRRGLRPLNPHLELPLHPHLRVAIKPRKPHSPINPGTWVNRPTQRWGRGSGVNSPKCCS
jgi:hypothetical protein